MELNHNDIAQFKAHWGRAFGETLSDSEAQMQALQLIEFFSMLNDMRNKAKEDSHNASDP